MGILDTPKPILNQDVFTKDETKMRPEVRLYILKHIYSFLGPGKLAGIFMLGSMADRKYNEKSDIDINLVLKPGLDRENIKDYIKQFSYTKLPGTDHEIGYYVQNYSEANYADYATHGVYDLVKDSWAKKPLAYEYYRDPNEEYKNELRYAKMFFNTFKNKTKEQKLQIIKKLSEERKKAYSFGWGVPKNSQQNILYKVMERALGLRFEKIQ
jgi:predicted nucleotidyltransferase